MNDGEPDELPPPSDDELEVLGLVNECEDELPPPPEGQKTFEFAPGPPIIFADLKYEYVSEVPSDLTCQFVCFDPLEDPIEHVKCQNLFCRRCIINSGLKCPLCMVAMDISANSRDIGLPSARERKRLDQLQVRCNDCQQIMDRSRYANHQFNICPKPCPNSCSEKVVQAQFDEHLKTCVNAVIACSFCGNGVPRFAMQVHVNESCRAPVFCPRRCNVQIPRCQLLQHEATCSALPIPCSQDCGVHVARGLLQNHINKSCIVPFPCPSGCSQRLPRSEFDQHALICDFVCVPCPQACGKQIPRRLIESHVNVACPVPVSCPQGCQMKIPKFKFADHFLVCEESLIECPGSAFMCSFFGSRKEVDIHVQSCQTVALQPSFRYFISKIEANTRAVHFLQQEIQSIKLHLMRTNNLGPQLTRFRRNQSVSPVQSNQAIHLMKELPENLQLPKFPEDLPPPSLSPLPLVSPAEFMQNWAGLDLHGRDLNSWDLSNLRLVGCRLTDSCLRQSDLSGALLEKCEVAGTDFQGACFNGAHLSNLDMSRSILSSASFIGCTFIDVQLPVELSQLNFSNSVFLSTDLSQADMRGANFDNADLSGAVLCYSNLSGASIKGARLAGNLRYASFVGVDFGDCDLTGADFTRSNLRNANLSLARLQGAILKDADLTGALLPNLPLHSPAQELNIPPEEQVFDERKTMATMIQFKEILSPGGLPPEEKSSPLTVAQPTSPSSPASIATPVSAIYFDDEGRAHQSSLATSDQDLKIACSFAALAVQQAISPAKECVSVQESKTVSLKEYFEYKEIKLDRGVAAKCEISLKRPKELNLVWSTSGTLANCPASVWAPKEEKDGLLSSRNKASVRVGYYVSNDLRSPAEKTSGLEPMLIRITDNSVNRLHRSNNMDTIIKACFPLPKLFTFICHIECETPLFIWRPVPPSNEFVALGVVCTTTPEQPDQNSVHCVPKRWCVPARTKFSNKIWENHGLNGSGDVSFWTLPSLHLFGVLETHKAPESRDAGGTWFDLFKPEFLMTETASWTRVQ